MNCPRCGDDDIVKRGSKSGQRLRCSGCGKWFKDKSKKEVKILLEVKEPIITWRDLTKVAKEHQKIREDLGFSHTEATISISTKKEGIIILPVADLHVGSEGTDYLFVEQLTDFIVKNDVYVVLVGDTLDTFFANFKSAAAIFQQILNPQEQEKFLDSWLKEIDNNLLAATWDNHSSMRIENILGHDIYGRLQSRFCPFFNGIGKLILKLNEQVYDIILTHKGIGRSSFNPLHHLYNLDRSIVEGDLFIGGHYHNQAFGSFEIRGKNVVAIQTGSAKLKDDHSQRYFRFDGRTPQFPCVFLSTKEKKIIPFLTIEDAIRFRDGKL
jgi:hypothetical protein